MVKVYFKCPKCGNFINYVLTDDDYEKIRLSGVCDLAIDHGDHILLMFIDAHGSVRGWKVYDKKLVVKPSSTLGAWRRINKEKFSLNGVDFLVADRYKMVFSDAFWSLDTDTVLKFFEIVETIIFVTILNKNVLLYPANGLRYAISNISKEELGNVARFLNLLTEHVGEKIIESVEQQKVVVVALSMRQTKLFLDYTIELLSDLSKDISIRVNRKTLEFLKMNKNVVGRQIDKNVISFLEKGVDEINLIDLVKKADLDFLKSFIPSYYRLKKLKILGVV